MYCIYYDRVNDVAILADNELNISICDIATLRDKFVQGEFDVKNLSLRLFTKEENIKPFKSVSVKFDAMFSKVLREIDFPSALRINNDTKYIVLEMIENTLYVDICDLEFIKDCIDTRFYSIISSNKLQERGLGINDNKDRYSRRQEYLCIKTIQARDYRRESNISICVREIKKGDKEESSDNEPKTEVRTDIEPVDLQLEKIEIEEKVEDKQEEKEIKLDFGDEEVEETLEDDFKPLYDEYDPKCELCHGKGRVLENGFIKECSCGARIKKLRELQEKREDVKPIFKVTNAIKENVVSYGLVPEEYKDIEYDEKIIQKIASQKYKGKKVKIQSYTNFVNALSTIIASCKTGQKLKHSYLIGGDKGFGKKTFVYTCLKYLYARNTPLMCKYISLSELGLLKAEAIKRASAIHNLGYYTRDNDRELAQRTIMEESKRAMNAILNDWFNTVKDSGGLKVALKAFGYKVDNDLTIDEQREELKNQKLILGKQFEDIIIRNAYARIAEEERIVNYGNEYCGKLVNTWEDYINAPIVFVHFSGVGERRFETEVLQVLLNIRGAKALPTIAIIETGLGIFKDEAIFMENELGDINSEVFKAKSYFWDSMLSDASDTNIKKIDKNKLKEEISSNIEYDRMVYIYSYAKYQDKLKVGVDI